MSDRLTQALDERSQLSRAYKAAKRAQFERAFCEEPRLRSFAAEIKRCGADDAELMISLARAHDGAWLRNADRDTRALALEIVATRIVQIRRKAELSEFDDPIFDEPDDVYQICRKILVP